MAINVGGVVCQRAQRKRVVVDVVGIAEHRHHKVTAAYVMRQIAEQRAAVRIIAQVLNDGPAIGISLGGIQFIFGSMGKFLAKQWLELRFPHHVDDGLMSENGVAKRLNGIRQKKNCGQENTRAPNTHRTSTRGTAPCDVQRVETFTRAGSLIIEYSKEVYRESPGKSRWTKN